MRLLVAILAAAGVLLVPAACGDSGREAPPKASPAASAPVAARAGQTATVNIDDFAFGPARVVVQRGARVRWRNRDTVEHTATADDGAFDTDVVRPGATSKPVVLTRSGRLAYSCALHATMTGTVEVR